MGMDILSVLLPRAAPGSPQISWRVAPHPAPAIAASTSHRKPSTKLPPVCGQGNGGVPLSALPAHWLGSEGAGDQTQRLRPASASLVLSWLSGGRASQGLGWLAGSVVVTGQPGPGLLTQHPVF